MAMWDDVLSARDKLVFAKAGYGRRQGFGSRPAVLVIDVNYNFVGDQPEPILKSIERYRNSCGEEGWQGVYQIQRLLKSARGKHLPIFYSTGAVSRSFLDMGGWAAKNARSSEGLSERGNLGNEIVKEIAPGERDIVIRKTRPSVFFGTPLMSYLHAQAVDTLLVTGCTTSGCVRATVVDAFSYNFKVTIVEECVFDRGEVSHKISLFDMQAKYADVTSLDEVERYLATLPPTLFDQ